MLSENIRWVGQITLEGERLTADNIVLNRDAVIGARLDKPGVRLSFVLVVLLLVAALSLSVTLFLQSLQFFDPDYTRFALSLIPLIALAWASFQLRPRNHLTVLISDGSALLLSSSDGNFLSMCLEAFERLWADKSRMRASLYLHAAHRSVDFGPSGTGLLAAREVSSVNDPLPPMPELPMFDDEDEQSSPDGEERDTGEASGTSQKNIVLQAVLEDSMDEALPARPARSGAEPDQEAMATQEAMAPPPLPAGAPDDDGEDHAVVVSELSVADLLGADGAPEEDIRVEPVLVDEPVETPSAEVPSAVAPSEETPSAETSMVEDPVSEDEDRLDALTAGEDMFDLAIEPEEAEAEQEPEEPEEPAGPVIERTAFDRIRPKVGTLSRLLRDRPDFAELIDAVDVMDLYVEAGCQTREEAEALAAAIATMRTPLAVYPAALQVVVAVADAGDLGRFVSAGPPDA